MTLDDVRTLFTQMLTVPYLPNDQSNPLHERNFQVRLETMGFRSARSTAHPSTKAVFANATKSQWMGRAFSGPALLATTIQIKTSSNEIASLNG
jgi:hypothetical protein